MTFQQYSNASLLQVDNMEVISSGCCRAVCARIQSCAAVKRSSGKCLISSNAILVHVKSNNVSIVGEQRTSAFVKRPHDAVIIDVEIKEPSGKHESQYILLNYTQ